MSALPIRSYAGYDGTIQLWKVVRNSQEVIDNLYYAARHFRDSSKLEEGDLASLNNESRLEAVAKESAIPQGHKYYLEYVQYSGQGGNAAVLFLLAWNFYSTPEASMAIENGAVPESTTRASGSCSIDNVAFGFFRLPQLSASDMNSLLSGDPSSFSCDYFCGTTSSITQTMCTMSATKQIKMISEPDSRTDRLKHGVFWNILACGDEDARASKKSLPCSVLRAEGVASERSEECTSEEWDTSEESDTDEKSRTYEKSVDSAEGNQSEHDSTLAAVLGSKTVWIKDDKDTLAVGDITKSPLRLEGTSRAEETPADDNETVMKVVTELLVRTKQTATASSTNPPNDIPKSFLEVGLKLESNGQRMRMISKDMIESPYGRSRFEALKVATCRWTSVIEHFGAVDLSNLSAEQDSNLEAALLDALVKYNSFIEDREDTVPATEGLEAALDAMNILESTLTYCDIPMPASKVGTNAPLAPPKDNRSKNQKRKNQSRKNRERRTLAAVVKEEPASPKELSVRFPPEETDQALPSPTDELPPDLSEEKVGSEKGGVSAPPSMSRPVSSNEEHWDSNGAPFTIVTQKRSRALKKPSLARPSPGPQRHISPSWREGALATVGTKGRPLPIIEEKFTLTTGEEFKDMTVQETDGPLSCICESLQQSGEKFDCQYDPPPEGPPLSPPLPGCHYTVKIPRPVSLAPESETQFDWQFDPPPEGPPLSPTLPGHRYTVKIPHLDGPETGEEESQSKTEGKSNTGREWWPTFEGRMALKPTTTYHDERGAGILFIPLKLARPDEYVRPDRRNWEDVPVVANSDMHEAGSEERTEIHADGSVSSEEAEFETNAGGSVANEEAESETGEMTETENEGSSSADEASSCTSASSSTREYRYINKIQFLPGGGFTILPRNEWGQRDPFERM